MAEEKKEIKSKVELKKITIDEISDNLDDIFEYNIAVWRKNKENKHVTIPMKKLEQFLGNKKSDSVFYIQNDWQERIKDAKSVKVTEKKEDSPSPMEEMEKYGDVEKQVEEFAKMSVSEREAVLDDSIDKLSTLTGGSLDISAVANMVDTVAKTFYSNNACFEDNLAITDIEKNLTGVFIKTNCQCIFR